MNGRRLLLAVALLSAAASAQDQAKLLTGVEKTKHFEIRFRPGSKAEASVDRVAALVEGDLRRILDELALADFKHTIRLFLYDDDAELRKITGVPCSGYSIPLESHVPHDNDQTRVHELVHVVAEKLPEKGPEPRNLFFAEGLANAVLRFVTGVHVDAVAAFHKRRGELPPLAEIHAIQDFYAWMRQRPGFNAYDVAGSWMRHLLDAYGPLKTRKYYCGMPAREAFGADLAAIEKAWHAKLDAVNLRPGLLALLESRAGGPPKNPAEAKLGEAVLGPASEWKKLVRSPVVEDDPGAWDGDALVLTGVKSQGDWCIARIAGKPVQDGMVRCRVELLDGCIGVQVQIGKHCQGMVLRGQGAFVYDDASPAGSGPADVGEKGVEIVVRRKGGRASVWVDGTLAVEGAVSAEAGLIGLGCVGGRAKVTALAFRPL